MQANQANSGAIAIIGLAGRFPGANSVSEFWDNLVAGRDALRHYTQEEVQQGIAAHDAASIPYVRKQVAGGSWVAAGYYLDDVDKFDAGFFGYTPAEAELLDPQQRLFLECAWAALEDAGYIPDDCPGTVGVYAGTALSRYFFNNIFPNRDIMFASSKDLIAGIGNEPDYITNRTAYKLNLTGPSITVQTACSTSLVAIHLACRALRAGECDSALAGGALATVPGGLGYQYQEGSMASPDGLLRTFDAKAEGTVFSEGGVGIVVLKRLEDALADHDRVYAVIRGTAVTNDGAFKAGYTAPGIDGQMHVIERALADAGVDPDQISYVEAHGTSTPLGDPIEITALARAWRKRTERTGYCALGSLKTNVGHLAPVAGVASVIKTALALWHRTLPPSLHFGTPNPRIDFANSPFFVNDTLRDWDCAGTRYAAVSSFGIGGTNAHAIMEEAPPQPVTRSGAKLRSFVLSAKSSKALSRAAENLDDFLRRQPGVDLDDVAFTLQEGRKAFPVRAAVAADSLETLQQGLAAIRDNPAKTKALPADAKKVFLFTGQGSQYLTMGRGLYQNLPVFRQVFDDCCDQLRGHLGLDLRDFVLAADPTDAALTEQLGQTRLAQPMLFAFEYALAKQMQALGIEPDAMIGHSLGEYVAACLAEVFELDAALRLVALRGALMQAMPSGAMLSVSLDETAVAAYVGGEVSLAAVNSPNACVLSGPHAAIAAVRERLEAAGAACRPLLTSHAFHSAMMQPMIADFTAAVRLAAPKTPSRPYVSNLTGDWMAAADACDPDYWARHLLGCVRFRQGMATLLAGGGSYFIEIGPGNVLSTFARHAINAAKAAAAVVQTVRHPKETKPDALVLRQALGDLWAAGLELDWERVDSDNQGRRISLPTYPFARERHWLEPPQAGAAGTENPAQRLADPAQWFYAPSWKRQPGRLPDIGDWSGERVLIVAERNGLSRALAERIEAAGGSAVIAAPGAGFADDGESGYSLNIGEAADFERLAAVFAEAQPTAIVHALCATPRSAAGLDSEDYWLERSFHSLVFLAQQFSAEAGDRRLPLLTLSSEIHDVLPAEPVNPLKAALLGVHLCLGHEYRKFLSRNLDFGPDDLVGAAAIAASADRAVGELARLRGETKPLLAPADHFAACRHGYRWAAHYEPTRIDPAPLDFTADGAYLVTGGLGGLGLAVADYMAARGAKHIVLLGRSALPPKAEWPRWLAEHEAQDRSAERIRKLAAIEARGAEVEICQGDVVDAERMTELVAALLDKYGRIAGVVHSAGVAGGGLIQLKTRDAAEAVLRPKVRGILALEQAFRAADTEPGFIVLFSSLFAVIGGIGQVDYSAANNVLDAYARAGFGASKVVSLNFGGWRETGMAVDAGLYARRELPPLPAGKTLAHPYLHSCREKSAQHASYAAWLREPDHWALLEHRIEGVATMPGTGLVEMVRAAFQDYRGAEQVAIDNLYFFRPLMVPALDMAEVHCDFNALPGGGYGFEVYTREAGVKAPLLAGDIYAAELAVARIDPQALAASCSGEVLDFSDGRPQAVQDDSGFLSLGPRWQVLSQIRCGGDHLLGRLQLPAAFVDDLNQFMLHPSLLDMASGPITGHLLRRLDLDIDGEYLPFGYGRLTIAAPLPAEFLSHVCFRGLSGDRESLSFDIALYDMAGQRLAQIDEFTLKKVPAGAFALPPATAADSHGEDDSLSTAEGLEIFQRALASAASPQWVISPQPLDALLERMQAQRAAEEAGTTAAKPKLQREDADAAPPTNPTEEILVGIMEGVLGIEPVGIYDNFFDMGVDSVMGIQVVSQAKRFGLTVKPNQLFEHQTVAALAAAIGASAPTAAEPAWLTFGQRELLAAGRGWDSLQLELPAAVTTDDLTAALAAVAADYPLLLARIEINGEAPSWTQAETVAILAADAAAETGGEGAFRVLADGRRLVLQARPVLGLDAAGLSQIGAAVLARLSGSAAAAPLAPWRPAAAADLAAAAGERDAQAESAGYAALPDQSAALAATGACAAAAEIRIEADQLQGLERLRAALNLDAEDLLLAALAASIGECFALEPVAVRYVQTHIVAESGAVLRYSYPLCLETDSDALTATTLAKAARKQAPSAGFGFELAASGLPLPSVRFTWLGHYGNGRFEPEAVLAAGEAFAVSACLAADGLLLRLAVDAEQVEQLPRLSTALENTVLAYLAAAEQAQGRGFTAADFGDAGLSEEDFATLFQTIE
ncbi:SDR family NAD(P)-dependent oxidoreductase [Methylomonas sp. EFPC3]|uniref:type I polyketide synthase n=1 Tax=Methylomonas sp. EFPC3 TaxID=3021710 RepID=UPI002415B807|nr:type I polyketide synthase [Methylomonas sp. EFPC3]WFP51889.1 SDR family NAD(P)-dependent oxidoreductase [Methylomonas sp. EFPC3]